MDIIRRPRRLRQNQEIRRMVRETRTSPSSLVLPLFIREGAGVVEEIGAMPDQYHYSPDTVSQAVEEAVSHGVTSILLFGIPGWKDEQGSGAYDPDGVVQRAVRAVKESYPEVQVITDVCLCEYTSHGHCGMLRGNVVDNDATLPLLAKIAVSHLDAGADIVAPSDMMDGRVGALRRAMDMAGYQCAPIMSYAVKYASAFYGPFREAAGSAPSFGDRKSYQMDCHNAREALVEAELDVGEGADILIVKPALSYLDVVYRVRKRFGIPVAAYSVSGEYAMIKSAAAAGMVDEYKAMCEAAVSVYRAGADILITYYAKELADAMKKGDVG